MFYRLLRSPTTLVPWQPDSNPPGLTKHEADAAISGEVTARNPNPATIFLRLCNLNSFPIERINRYETVLWRQAVQTLFLLDGCRKRLPNCDARGDARFALAWIKPTFATCHNAARRLRRLVARSSVVNEASPSNRSFPVRCHYLNRPIRRWIVENKPCTFYAQA